MAKVNKEVSADHQTMDITLTINKDELAEYLMGLFAKKMFENSWNSESFMLRQETKQAVRETIYKNKDEIVDRVVKQATAEVKRSALKKWINDIGDEQ